jgi:hypothetical protein
MAYETKEGAGSLFRNDRKEKPGHPDYQGQLRINGTLYRVSGWIKESQKGTKWMSLALKPDEREAAAAPAKDAKKATEASCESHEFNDPLPPF